MQSGGNPGTQSLQGSDAGPPIPEIGTRSPISFAIDQILRGKIWNRQIIIDPGFPSHLAHKIKVQDVGPLIRIQCWCGKVVWTHILGATGCVCDTIYAVTHRRLMVTFRLDDETEQKVAVVRAAMANPHAFLGAMKKGLPRGI